MITLDPIDQAKGWALAVAAVTLALVIGGAIGVPIGWAIAEKHHADVAHNEPAQVCMPVTTITHDAAVAAQVSTHAAVRAAHVHDQTSAAASSAVIAIDALPPAGTCAARDDSVLVDAWRNGIVGMRDAAGRASSDAADDSGGAAEVVQER